MIRQWTAGGLMVVMFFAAGVIACGGGEQQEQWEPPEGTALRFAPLGDAFFDVPFPDDVRSQDGFDGVFRQWPGADNQQLLRLWFDAADDLVDGWGLSSAVFGYFSEAIDPSTLPQSVDDSVDLDGGYPSVFLIDVDAESTHRGEVLPITCQFRNEAGSYHDENQLGCISPYGVLRRPDTRYALVITDELKDVDGDAVVPDEAMARLLRGEDISDDGQVVVDAAGYQEALEVVEDRGVGQESVASLVLMTTLDPSARLRRISQWYRELPTPQIDEDIGLSVVDEYDDYVVLQGHYDVPVIQEGSRPYSAPPAGEILFDDDGNPQIVDEQSIRFYITVPRQEMSDDGFATLLYLHGSGGVAEELLNRGARPDEDTEPPEGTGPAGVVAPYGVAGFAADFNLHGMRHSPRDRTGLQLYNLIQNPRAAIDNFIIAASEVGLHARLMESLEIEVRDVDGLAPLLPDELDTIRFDSDAFAAMGQSMGSTIGLPALTVDSVIDAGIFSGSGGILIEVALESTKPINVGTTLRAALNYERDEELDRYDPILSAIQHIWDLVDPVAHARFLVDEPHEGFEPTHALQHSGLDDGYFSIESRAAFSTALGAQIADPVEEPEAFEQMRWRDLDEPLALPATGNRDGTTSVVTQYHPSVLDGHNVAYQRDDAKAQYACFVWSMTVDPVPTLRSAQDSAVEACVGE